MISREELAKMIDHTELKASSGQRKIKKLCEDAVNFGFYSVCVNPCHTEYVSNFLKNYDVETCIVVGFPLGANKTELKAAEAEKAVEEGAGEIDMVINNGLLREGNYDYVRDDIKAVVEASYPAHVKVILENCYLTDEQIVKGCQLSVEAGAKFVKTSTGFGAFGAFPQHVKLMRDTVGPDIGVKAAGGIHNFKDAWRLIQAGADRIGASAGISILEGLSQYKYARDAWLEPEIPCHICPSRHVSLSSVPTSVYKYYKKKCDTCKYKDKYNEFYV